MFSKCRMMLVGMVVFCGASLVAMDKKAESPRNLLSCSAELRKTSAARQIVMNVGNTFPASKSDEMRLAEKEAYNNAYYPYCGSRTPPEYYWTTPLTMSQRTAPYGPGEFPGR